MLITVGLPGKEGQYLPIATSAPHGKAGGMYSRVTHFPVSLT